MRTKTILIVTVTAVSLLVLSVSAQSATVSGVVTNGPGGPGVNKALVVLVAGSNIAGAAKTGANGKYRIAGVGNGRYSLIVSASGYQSKVTTVAVSGATTANVDLVKRASSDYRNLGRIVGFVKATGNKPVPNALLLLKKGNAFVGATRPENATGVYELEWYAPGNYTVVVVAPGYNTATYSGQKITAGESLWLDVVLQPQ
ncbi:MAG: carboxypeptidase regulatory-like domain-containing protein [Armatimonadetes bacterium]|nr:carboxypeptidase regulatory-like domain-containing protein [Armatimonadota bacterium]